MPLAKFRTAINVYDGRVTPVRRQQRGLARIEQLLDAAAKVFAQVGYERATTNAIAAEAGVSPGTLYQFFRNKEDIAAALVQRYLVELEEAHTEALTGFDPVATPLADVIAHLLDPLIAFKESHAAYVMLFVTGTLPDALAEPVARSEAAFQEQVTALIRTRSPHLDTEVVERASRTVFALIAGVMDQLTSNSELAAELRLVMLGYLHTHGIR